MITLTGVCLCTVLFSKTCNIFDNNMRLILLSVIQLSVRYCNLNFKISKFETWIYNNVQPCVALWTSSLCQNSERPPPSSPLKASVSSPTRARLKCSKNKNGRFSGHFKYVIVWLFLLTSKTIYSCNFIPFLSWR